MIMGVALAILTPLALQAQRSSFVLDESFDNALIRQSLDSMEEAASLVHAQGEPARVTFRIRLPAGITATAVADDYASVERRLGSGQTTTFVATFPFNVSGSIPVQDGIHTMVAEAEDGYVNITAR